MSILVMGHHYWGHGQEINEAKANFKKQGGKLSLGYKVITFDDSQEFGGVDQLGRVFWTGEGEPTVREVKGYGRKS